MEPLIIADAERLSKVDISILTHGGGVMGQTDAIRTAIARGLVHYNGAEGLDEELRDEFLRFDRSLLVNDHVVRNRSTNLDVVLAERSRNLTGDLDDYTIRCFSCGLIAHKWEEFNEKKDAEQTSAAALDELGFERYCCRRMFVSHIDLIDGSAFQRTTW